MMLRFLMAAGSFQCILFRQVSIPWRVRFGSLLSHPESTLPYYFHQSISLWFIALVFDQGYFISSIFSLLKFILMRHTFHLPGLTFDPGSIVFSPCIISSLKSSSSLRAYIDHFLECHLATDFGIISRSTRFDNTLAALLGSGHLTSRYFIPRDICPPHSGLIITTHLDEHTTTIRFASEQE